MSRLITSEALTRVVRHARADALEGIYLDWVGNGRIAWKKLDGPESRETALLDMVSEALLDDDKAVLLDMRATFIEALSRLEHIEP